MSLWQRLNFFLSQMCLDWIDYEGFLLLVETTISGWFGLPLLELRLGILLGDIWEEEPRLDRPVHHVTS